MRDKRLKGFHRANIHKQKESLNLLNELFLTIFVSMKHLFLVLFTLIGSFISRAYAQLPQLSSNTTVSVLSCGPGDDLYSKFGHSAIRIKDFEQNIDVVYNYGVFDFDAPNFYLNFAKGKLDYMLARHRTNSFVNAYRQEGRWIHEQVIQFTDAEKQKLFSLLEENAKPENRTYSYDFFYNNCATKIIDVLSEATNNRIEYNEDFIENNVSFRALINNEIGTNSWGSFGINLALGSVIDVEASDFEHRFLPKYVEKQLDNSQYKDRALVVKQIPLLEEAPNKDQTSNFISTPLFWGLILLIFSLGASYYQWKYKSYPKAWDAILFSLSGALGLFLLALWFLTDHTATANNYNILWALPFNVLLACEILRGFKHPKTSKYLTLLSIGGILLFIVVKILEVQDFNPIIYLLAFSLAIRSIFIHKHLQDIK